MRYPLARLFGDAISGLQEELWPTLVDGPILGGASDARRKGAQESSHNRHHRKALHELWKPVGRVLPFPTRLERACAVWTSPVCMSWIATCSDNALPIVSPATDANTELSLIHI